MNTEIKMYWIFGLVGAALILVAINDTQQNRRLTDLEEKVK